MKVSSRFQVAPLLGVVVFFVAEARGWELRARFERAAARVAGALVGDVDGDGDIDRDDAAVLVRCVGSSGPSVIAGAACAATDADLDQDVDLYDAAAFQNAFSGAIGEPPVNNACSAAIAVGEGSHLFNNRAATTDGTSEAMCRFGGDSQIGSDVWFCHVASCTGPLVVSACGSGYDTKLAVYAGCDCPAATLLACSDDDCGVVETIQSRVEFAALAGQSYLIRVGGFLGEQGDGRLTIGCAVEACAAGGQDCFAPSTTSRPGCGDVACCGLVCAVDRFCCDVTWDAECVEGAEGLCRGHFPTCRTEGLPCDAAHPEPGCSRVDCCDALCAADPYCCLAAWDEGCVNDAQASCFLTCGGGAQDCFAPHPTPGCDRDDCCRTVCTADPFCCETEWDQACADSATAGCP